MTDMWARAITVVPILLAGLIAAAVCRGAARPPKPPQRSITHLLELLDDERHDR